MKRTKRREFVMTEKEASELTMKAQKACMSESHLIRLLISGYHPPEAPGMEFYEHLNILADEASKMQLTSELLKDPEMKEILIKTAADINKLTMEIRRRFLTGERERIEWR